MQPKTTVIQQHCAICFALKELEAKFSARSITFDDMAYTNLHRVADSELKVWPNVYHPACHWLCNAVDMDVKLTLSKHTWY